MTTIFRRTFYLVRRLRRPEYLGQRAPALRRLLVRFYHEEKRAARLVTSAILVSHPKSGRTWLRYMLDNYGLCLEYTHDTHVPNAKGGPKRIILLHRDPRDTVVSHWFQLTRRQPIFSGSFAEFVRDTEFGLEAIVRFNLTWMEWIGARGGFVLTYEGLHADPLGELGKLIAFVRSRAAKWGRLRKAVEAGRFNEMRAVELSGRGRNLYGDALEPADPDDPNSFKVREGRVGGWKAHFSPSDAAYAEAVLAQSEYWDKMALIAPLASRRATVPNSRSWVLSV